jgi:hypothetical protein
VVELLPEWENPTRVKQFLRHFVPIHLRFEKDSREVHQFYSAMLFSVDSRWMMFTAAHCIRRVAEARAHGYKLTHGRLLDSLGTNALSPEPVPFDWDAAEPHTLSKDETWDYGVLFPPFNTCQLLEANGVVPFSEPFWAAPPPPNEIVEYQLVGLPEQGTVQTGFENFRFNLMMMRVLPELQRPEGFAETNAPMFYGRVAKNPFTTLHGFSGSPILAFTRPDETGLTRYYLHAMQVSQWKGTDYISGMLITPLGHRYQWELAQGNAP